ncbi:hypothetical protein C8R44DRAFT_728160 [Mycena epipterygia]|nr:hypothetical protein C8R44DRAFT_728160 [Mycena epipterygia]
MYNTQTALGRVTSHTDVDCRRPQNVTANRNFNGAEDHLFRHKQVWNGSRFESSKRAATGIRAVGTTDSCDAPACLWSDPSLPLLAWYEQDAGRRDDSDRRETDRTMSTVLPYFRIGIASCYPLLPATESDAYSESGRKLRGENGGASLPLIHGSILFNPGATAFPDVTGHHRSRSQLHQQIFDFSTYFTNPIGYSMDPEGSLHSMTIEPPNRGHRNGPNLTSPKMSRRGVEGVAPNSAISARSRRAENRSAECDLHGSPELSVVAQRAERGPQGLLRGLVRHGSIAIRVKGGERGAEFASRLAPAQISIEIRIEQSTSTTVLKRMSGDAIRGSHRHDKLKVPKSPRSPTRQEKEALFDEKDRFDFLDQKLDDVQEQLKTLARVSDGCGSVGFEGWGR